jgi:hypothetical protein
LSWKQMDRLVSSRVKTLMPENAGTPKSNTTKLFKPS